MTFLFALIALDLAAAELPKSELVPADHAHHWVEIDREIKRNAEVMLLDIAEQPDYANETGTFPTALLRGAETKNGGAFYYVDVRVAIDCEASRMAMVALAEPKIDENWPKEPNARLGEFGPLVDENHDSGDEKVLTAMFKHVCGPEWSYEFPQ